MSYSSARRERRWGGSCSSSVGVIPCGITAEVCLCAGWNAIQHEQERTLGLDHRGTSDRVAVGKQLGLLESCRAGVATGAAAVPGGATGGATLTALTSLASAVVTEGSLPDALDGACVAELEPAAKREGSIVLRVHVACQCLNGCHDLWAIVEGAGHLWGDLDGATGGLHGGIGPSVGAGGTAGTFERAFAGSCGVAGVFRCVEFYYGAFGSLEWC